jgi:3-oxoacyl-[acyl-carrier-protein] synthase III
MFKTKSRIIKVLRADNYYICKIVSKNPAVLLRINLVRSVYITKIAKFLPNNPISNNEMEDYLGKIDNKSSKARPIVLRSNGIKNRYYAIDKDGVSTHSNAQLTAQAIQNLTDDHFSVNDIELLACGTTSPDQILPSHAVMVHGELRTRQMELFSSAGACCSGIQALKIGYMSVLSANSANAVCTGSEKLATWMLAKKFRPEQDDVQQHFNANPYIAFEKEFIRWMLSDGSAAALLEAEPNKDKVSLKIEWIEMTSFAHLLDTCMYAGAEKNEDGSLTSWNDMNPANWYEKHIFSLKQDVRMLGDNIVSVGMKLILDSIQKHKLDLEEVTYFLPHLSSEFFRDKIRDGFLASNVDIPAHKWFTNLSQVGNVGAASPYLMLEELMNNDRLKVGDKILLMVPESARFSYAFALLTVV